MTQRSTRPLILLNLVIALIGLGILSYLGFHNRFWSDDWCFEADFKEAGVVSTIGKYFATGDDAQTGYAPNRYSFVSFVGLFHLPGMLGTRILPTVTILLWLGGLIWVVQNVTRKKILIEQPALLLACALLLLYTLYLSTSRFQILYWRSGVFPYTWSIIFGLLILGAITSQLTGERSPGILLPSIAVLSFVGGGFSEVGSAFLVSGFTLLLGATVWERRKSTEWAVRLFPAALTAWIFLLVAMLALLISPSNSRYGGLDQAPVSLFSVPFIALRYALDFIVFGSLKSLSLPHLVFCVMFLALGLLTSQMNATAYSPRTAIITIVISAAVTYLLVAAIQAPTVFLTASTPDPRGQSLSRFTLFAGLGIIAWILGGMIPTRIHTYATVMASLVLVACAVYTARVDLNIYREIPGFMQRAEQWDARDSHIKSSLAQGITRVEIDGIDTSVIDTRDIIRSKEFGNWLTNICGVRYYGVEALRVP